MEAEVRDVTWRNENNIHCYREQFARLACTATNTKSQRLLDPLCPETGTVQCGGRKPEALFFFLFWPVLTLFLAT